MATLVFLIASAGIFAVFVCALIKCCSGKRNKLKNSMFKGKHVLITGGSSGLGKELAKSLLIRGASVTIAARRILQLEEAKRDLEPFTSKGTKLEIVSVDVTDADSCVRMLEEAEGRQSASTDCVICCAGAAVPGFFHEQDPKTFASQIALNYLGAVNSIHPYVRETINRKRRGRIVLISSTVGLMGMVGYSQYSPTKFALRGLAESLRQELHPHSINTHIYYVATIDSPGNKVENETKPEITKIIEDGDMSNHSPAARAETLLEGMEAGQFAITSDLLTDLFRCASLGAAPGNNYICDSLKGFLARIGIPAWRIYADRLVVRHLEKDK